MENSAIPTDKPWLFGLTLDELERIAAENGMPRFAARQIASWLYRKGADSIGGMTDLSLKNREKLAGKYELGTIPFANVQRSADGTKKYLFPTLQGRFIESAYIPDGDRATLCVSSQSGCRMGCRFCMTARQGFAHHLTAGEILNQIRSIPESDRLTNVVYMGMGEPLDNAEQVIRSIEVLTSDWGYGWSPTRITVSTIGVIPAMRELLRRTRVHLAVSLHDPIPAERAAMMPAAASTLLRYFAATNTRPQDFDAIFTGDLGEVGSALLREQMAKEGVPLDNHQDCGCLLYDTQGQNVQAGGSGAGCSAAVLCCKILPMLAAGQLRRVLFMATGALMSQTTFLQGESIPGIAHCVELGGAV